MPIKNIPIDEASEQQLRDYASKFLNIDIGDADPKAAIQRAHPGVVMISYLEDEPAIAQAEDVQPPAEGGMIGSLGRGDPKWKINIPIVESEDNSGKNDVTVGVNGRAWQMKRGVDIIIPHRVKIALDNAIADQVRHDDEGEVMVNKTRRFPYQTLEQPTPAEIEAWEAETSQQFCA